MDSSMNSEQPHTQVRLLLSCEVVLSSLSRIILASPTPCNASVATSLKELIGNTTADARTVRASVDGAWPPKLVSTAFSSCHLWNTGEAAYSQATGTRPDDAVLAFA
jgi:hypothetical protein